MRAQELAGLAVEDRLDHAFGLAERNRLAVADKREVVDLDPRDQLVAQPFRSGPHSPPFSSSLIGAASSLPHGPPSDQTLSKTGPAIRKGRRKLPRHADDAIDCCLFAGPADGVLVPVEHLVNGVSIVQCEAVERVAYFHRRTRQPRCDN